MFRIYTVIVVFLIISLEENNSASVYVEKEIGDTPPRELEFNIINGNSSFEARSRTKTQLKDNINEIVPYRVKRYAHHHMHIHGKTYVKMPSGINVYIKKHNMEGFKCGEKTSIKDLDPSEYEYKVMDNEMQASIKTHPGLTFSKYNITKVQRVINGCLMRRYLRRLKAIRSEYHHVNERILYHGTNKVNEILDSGFDERYASMTNMFGAGMYFAEHSSKSNQYAFGFGGGCALHGDAHCMICERKMIVCRVALGKIHMVKHATPLTSHPPPGYHSLEGVASNGGLKYNEYVVYRGEQAYPEYVITYHLIP